MNGKNEASRRVLKKSKEIRNKIRKIKILMTFRRGSSTACKPIKLLIFYLKFPNFAKVLSKVIHIL